MLWEVTERIATSFVLGSCGSIKMPWRKSHWFSCSFGRNLASVLLYCSRLLFLLKMNQASTGKQTQISNLLFGLQSKNFLTLNCTGFSVTWLVTPNTTSDTNKAYPFPTRQLFCPRKLFLSLENFLKIKKESRNRESGMFVIHLFFSFEILFLKDYWKKSNEPWITFLQSADGPLSPFLACPLSVCPPPPKKNPLL